MPRRTKSQTSKAPKGRSRGKAASSSTVPSPLSAPSKPTAASTSADPQAIRLPEPPKEGLYYRSAAVFALGIMVLAGLLYAIVREASVDRTPPAPPPVDDPLFDEVRHRDEFKDWLSEWRTVDPYVSASEFTLESQGAITPAVPAETAAQPSQGDLQPPLANRYVWSPDHSRYVDYLASFGEPDSRLDLFGRLDGKLETLVVCGTPCRFNGAFWLDDDRVIALGVTDGLKQDGTQLCLPAGANEERRCYDRLTLAVYDLTTGQRTSYRSENHLFGDDPFARAAEERWASGFSEEERASMGIGSESVMDVITGDIIDIAEDGRILTVGGGRVPRFLAVSDKASIRDVAGEPLSFEGLHDGFTIEARAVRQADGTSLAISIRVIAAPNIIVEEPKENATVPARFAVHGVARTFESNVQLRLLNDRTGKVLAEKFTTTAAPGVGMYGDFSFDVKMPTASLRSGDPLLLEVFDTSAENGAKTDLVILHLLYRP